MAPGADKVISFSPAGGLGLVDQAAPFLIRFDEVASSTRPQDETGACADFDIAVTPVATVLPAGVAAVLGRGRQFNGTTMAMAARDRTPGTTLFTRDASIQVVLSWDIAAQNAAGTPGTIVSRGLGGSAAEFVAYGLRLDVVNAGTFTGLLRWYWQDVAGVDRLQDGAQVCMLPGQFTMLTATRRWVSPTSVELRYYVGDQLIGTVASTNGSIGGGTTGAMQLGCRTVGGANGAFLAGTMDELAIVDRELSAEEIEATWLRITRYQPLGVQLFKDMIDRDFPISDLRDSDAELDIRKTGHVLGFAAAQAENLRANFLPQRAYGSTLEQWEQAVAVTPKPGLTGSIEERRARVLARLRQKQGVSISGVKEALRDLVDCDVDDLQFIAYDNTVVDGFDTVIDPLRWDQTPTGAPPASWNAGKARFALGAGTYVIDNSHRDWRPIARGVSQPSPPGAFGGEHLLGKVALPVPQNNIEVGIWFGDRAAGNILLLGLRQDGVFKVATESFVGWESRSVTVQAVLGANPAALWLHLWEHASGLWTAAWSTTGPTSGFASSAPIAHPTVVYWAGFYVRSIAAVGALAVADVDDFELFTPNGTRPFNVYVFRNPALGGTPDRDGARSVIRAVKHAFTHATMTESMTFIVGVGGSQCGLDPL